jgi:RimJ/RimL family protein N-acetyltransferase
VTTVEDRTTSRLYLRRVTLDDLPAIVAIESDPATNEHRPGGARTPEDSERTVREFVQGWQEHGVGYWAVEFEGRLVGVVGVRPMEFRGLDSWNLYFRFSPAVWGKGLAVEASREAVAVAKALQTSWPVVARVRPTNKAALRVAERSGLTRRPDLDGDGFAVLARNWPAPMAPSVRTDIR